MTAPDHYASVRYLVDDVQAAVDFYTTYVGFTLNTNAAPVFADVVRGSLRLLLSGPASSGSRATPDDTPAGRNRIPITVNDLAPDVAPLAAAAPPLPTPSPPLYAHTTPPPLLPRGVPGSPPPPPPRPRHLRPPRHS